VHQVLSTPHAPVRPVTRPIAYAAATALLGAAAYAAVTILIGQEAGVVSGALGLLIAFGGMCLASGGLRSAWLRLISVCQGMRSHPPQPIPGIFPRRGATGIATVVLVQGLC
jgi:hypothetical protein